MNDRERERRRVREHVAGVGQERERTGELTAHRLCDGVEARERKRDQHSFAVCFARGTVAARRVVRVAVRMAGRMSVAVIHRRNVRRALVGRQARRVRIQALTPAGQLTPVPPRPQ